MGIRPQCCYCHCQSFGRKGCLRSPSSCCLLRKEICRSPIGDLRQWSCCPLRPQCCRCHCQPLRRKGRLRILVASSRSSSRCCRCLRKEVRRCPIFDLRSSLCHCSLCSSCCSSQWCRCSSRTS